MPTYAARSMRAMEAYQAISLLPDSDKQSDKENVTDLLTNLMHYCNFNGVEFNRCLSNAALHYNAETTGE